MKVKMHVTLDTGSQVFLPGEATDVDEKMGKYLLIRGYASPVVAQKQETEDVPEKQETEDVPEKNKSKAAGKENG